MGNYNPERPHIIGEEWAPIRNEQQQFSPRSHPFDVGATFNLSGSENFIEGRYYLTELPTASVSSQVFSMAIYPRNLADNSGPVQRIVIPCAAGVVSGASITLGGGAASTVDALSDPSDEKYVTFNLTTITSTSALYLSFNTSLYSAIANKRILGVNLLYSVSDDWGTYNTQTSDDYISLTNDGSFAGVTQVGLPYGQFTQFEPTLGRKSFGEVDYFWSVANPTATTERLPYNFTGLQKFSNTATNTRVRVRILIANTASTTVTDARMHYAALEVFYCEEQRVMIGGRSYGGDATLSTPFAVGANKIPMRTMETYTAGGVTINAGEYLATLSVMEPGDCTLFTSSADPKLNALRELYTLPSHVGMRVNLPFPLDETAVGKVFSSEQTHIIPQMSFHNTGLLSPIPGIHVYGRQAIAQVYGSVTAVQEITTAGVGLNISSFPQVRYYARRFGDTMIPLLLDSTTITGTGKSVQITPAEFDALPEIIDGWKEVTLRFTSPPSFDNATSAPTPWRWSASNELVGNRWEVLGASAIALSGTAGNTLRLAPSAQRLSDATYFADSSTTGSTTNLAWVPGISPIVASTTDDESADAVLIFSGDPPTITGFTVTQLTQSLSTVDPSCTGDVAACIPTGLTYNKITWDPVAVDNFNRTATSSWGTADSGESWDTSGSGNDVTNGVATHTVASASSVQGALSSVGMSDVEVYLETYAATPVLTGGASHGIQLRYASTNEYDYGFMTFSTSGNVSIGISRRIAGVTTLLSSISNITTYTSNVVFAMKMYAYDRMLKLKVWRKDIDPEPNWQIYVQDNTKLTAQGVGIRTEASTPLSPAPWVATYQTFRAYPSTLSDGGAWQLQRKDPYTSWQTIMSATDMGTWYFNDYEARVGVTSQYQMRIVNLYDFAGLWSVTGSQAMATPGVTGTSADSGILIFTTNSVQDGSKNLAYAATWDFNISEDFAWPEGGQFTFQQMYGKDFPTGFHQLERGGEQFSRSILVNAVGVPPVVSDGFQDLRDMAWEDVPYICVRDELGNVWYAAVLVPGGSRQRMNVGTDHLKVAAVSVVQVTDTPYPVDPEA